MEPLAPAWHYGVDFVAQGDHGSDIACTGKPKKRFLMGPVDYGWEGGGLANELNRDAQLRKMLIKAKVPVITNHL